MSKEKALLFYKVWVGALIGAAYSGLAWLLLFGIAVVTSSGVLMWLLFAITVGDPGGIDVGLEHWLIFGPLTFLVAGAGLASLLVLVPEWRARRFRVTRGGVIAAGICIALCVLVIASLLPEYLGSPMSWFAMANIVAVTCIVMFLAYTPDQTNEYRKRVGANLADKVVMGVSVLAVLVAGVIYATRTTSHSLERTIERRAAEVCSWLEQEVDVSGLQGTLEDKTGREERVRLLREDEWPKEIKTLRRRDYVLLANKAMFHVTFGSGLEGHWGVIITKSDANPPDGFRYGYVRRLGNGVYFWTETK